MKATVWLKEGRSYHWNGHVFKPNAPSFLTDAREIEACKRIGVLRVEVEEDEPVQDDGVHTNDVEAAGGEGEDITKPIKASANKPGPKANKPGPKAAAPKPAQQPKPPTQTP